MPSAAASLDIPSGESDEPMFGHGRFASVLRLHNLSQMKLPFSASDISIYDPTEKKTIYTRVRVAYWPIAILSNIFSYKTNGFAYSNSSDSSN